MKEYFFLKVAIVGYNVVKIVKGSKSVLKKKCNVGQGIMFHGTHGEDVPSFSSSYNFWT